MRKQIIIISTFQVHSTLNTSSCTIKSYTLIFNNVSTTVGWIDCTTSCGLRAGRRQRPLGRGRPRRGIRLKYFINTFIGPTRKRVDNKGEKTPSIGKRSVSV